MKYEPSVHLKECNLCGKSEFETIRKRDRYGLPVTVVRCLGCGLRFINPRMTGQEYLEFYRDGTYRKLLEALERKSFNPAAIQGDQVVYARRLVDRLSPFMGDHATLLDVGGSAGVVAETVGVAFGLDPTVLDPSEAELEASAAKANMEVIPGVLGSGTSDIEPGSFDVVLLCRTVEHLTDIKAALSEIRRLLASGGLFFVDIAKGSRAKVDHCFYLDESTMREYLERAGFSDVDVKTEYWRRIRHLPKRVSFVAVSP